MGKRPQLTHPHTSFSSQPTDVNHTDEYATHKDECLTHKVEFTKHRDEHRTQGTFQAQM
jgi:hypothetical protein